MVVPTLRGAALNVSGSEVESQPLWLLLTLARWIEPTEAGRAAKTKAIKILDEQKRHFLGPLTLDQQNELLAILKLLQRPPPLPG